MTERVFKGLTAVFLAMEAVLYAAFLTLDLTDRGGAAIPIKYGGILLCLGFAALCALRGGELLVLIALWLFRGRIPPGAEEHTFLLPLFLRFDPLALLVHATRA